MRSICPDRWAARGGVGSLLLDGGDGLCEYRLQAGSRGGDIHIGDQRMNAPLEQILVKLLAKGLLVSFQGRIDVA